MRKRRRGVTAPCPVPQRLLLRPNSLERPSAQELCTWLAQACANAQIITCSALLRAASQRLASHTVQQHSATRWRADAFVSPTNGTGDLALCGQPERAPSARGVFFVHARFCRRAAGHKEAAPLSSTDEDEPPDTAPHQPRPDHPHSQPNLPRPEPPRPQTGTGQTGTSPPADDLRPLPAPGRSPSPEAATAHGGPFESAASPICAAAPHAHAHAHAVESPGRWGQGDDSLGWFMEAASADVDAQCADSDNRGGAGATDDILYAGVIPGAGPSALPGAGDGLLADGSPPSAERNATADVVYQEDQADTGAAPAPAARSERAGHGEDTGAWMQRIAIGTAALEARSSSTRGVEHVDGGAAWAQEKGLDDVHGPESVGARAAAVDAATAQGAAAPAAAPAATRRACRPLQPDSARSSQGSDDALAGGAEKGLGGGEGGGKACSAVRPRSARDRRLEARLVQRMAARAARALRDGSGGGGGGGEGGVTPVPLFERYTEPG